MAFLALLRRNRALRRIVLFQFLAGLQLGAFTLVFNLYLLALGRGEDLAGVAAGAMTLALSVAALAAGPLASWWGSGRVLAGGLALASAAGVAQALAVRPVPIVACALLVGCGSAMLQALQMPLITECAAPVDRPEAAALASAVQTLSLTGGTLLGGLLPELLARAGIDPVAHYRAALLAAVGLGAFGVLPLLGLDWGSGKWAGRAGGPPRGAPLDPTPRAARRLIGRYAGATALIAVGAGAFLPFVNVYLARLGASPGRIGLWLGLTGLLGALLGLAGPALARRVGRERLAVALRLAPVLPGLALLAAPAAPLVVLTYAARQVGAGMTWPIEATLLAERVPAGARAGAFGLRIAAWNLAWAASSAAAGQLIVRGGYRYPVLLLVSSTALGALALWAVFRPTPRGVPARAPDAAVSEPTVE